MPKIRVFSYLNYQLKHLFAGFPQLTKIAMALSVICLLLIIFLLIFVVYLYSRIRELQKGFQVNILQRIIIIFKELKSNKTF